MSPRVELIYEQLWPNVQPLRHHETCTVTIGGRLVLRYPFPPEASR